MKIKFLPQNTEIEISPGQSVLDLAQQNGIHIQSVCKGIPSCAECRVYIKEGEHNVMPPQPKELELIGTAYFVDQRRLSCQLRCFGDVVVDLSEQIEKQNKSTKNPQGRYVKEREDSHARMGNVLEELTEEEMAYEASLISEARSTHSDTKIEGQKDRVKSKIDKGSFYNTQNSNQQNSQKAKGSTPKNSGGPQTARPEGSSAKRNRNRKRNKNRNNNNNSGSGNTGTNQTSN